MALGKLFYVMLVLFPAIFNSMSEQPKVQLQINTAYGVAGNVEGNQNIHVSEKQKSLAEAAAEIQQLLEQLEKSNPTATEKEKVSYISAAIAPPVKKRLLSAIKAGGKAALEEFLDNPYLNVTMAVIEDWKATETE